MPQEVLRQVRFTGGELDPRCVGRRDLKAYASSLALAKNLVVMPQGPARRRPGMRHVDYIRGPLEPVDLSPAVFSAPGGGDPADALSGAGFVSDAVPEDEVVMIAWSFDAPVTLTAIDLTDFAIVPDGDDAEPAPPQYPWERGPVLDFNP